MADLGSFTIKSDSALASSLTPEEAALYECIKLHVKDVSAYAVDGEFSFSALEDAAREHAEEVSNMYFALQHQCGCRLAWSPCMAPSVLF